MVQYSAVCTKEELVTLILLVASKRSLPLCHTLHAGVLRILQQEFMRYLRLNNPQMFPSVENSLHYSPRLVSRRLLV